ncbi:uncharacterized protein LOC135844749 [Planococcus citri]|uniref:uncharacterized protein LOC135844749 n=1 Tax=Planococcus citri TaxID=170843 RepID=UPI0031F8AF4C
MPDPAEIETGIFVFNELREIFVIIKRFLQSLDAQIRLYPHHSIVGSSTRSFAMNFVNAWRKPLEKVLLSFENTQFQLIHEKFSSDGIVQNLSKRDFSVENGILLITALINRLNSIFEFVSSASTLDEDNSADNVIGSFGLWLCVQMRPFPKIVYPKILEEFSESSRGLNDLRPKGC